MSSNDVTTSPPNEFAREIKIQELGATAPRVTPDDVDREIERVHYATAGDAHYRDDIRRGSVLDRVTICTIVLRNGWTLVGTSACVSAENFRPEIGQQRAYEKARDQIFMLLGFRLADRLHEERLIAKADDFDVALDAAIKSARPSDCRDDRCDLLRRHAGIAFRNELEGCAHAQYVNDATFHWFDHTRRGGFAVEAMVGGTTHRFCATYSYDEIVRLSAHEIIGWAKQAARDLRGKLNFEADKS